MMNGIYLISIRVQDVDIDIYPLNSRLSFISQFGNK